jgi:tetratricopeptide (TPR) repeat protein
LNPLSDELLLRIHLALTEHLGARERLEWFHGAVAEVSSSPMLTGLYAETLLENAQYTEALRQATSIVREHPDRVFGYLLGIKSLSLLERYAEALALADRGVSVLPEEGRLRLARAQLLRDTGRTDEALRELDYARTLLPDDPEVSRQQALTFGSIGKIHEAVRLLEGLAESTGRDHAETFFWLGYFQLHRKHYRQALEAAEHLMRLAPGAPEGFVIRGAALHGLRRHEEANTALARVQADDPALLARLSGDPVVAALLGATDEPKLLERLRRSVTQYWQQFSQSSGQGS